MLDSSYGDFIIVQFQMMLLTPEERARIRYEPQGMYEFENYRYTYNKEDVAHDGYEPWYVISIDGTPIASVLRNPNRPAD